VNVTTVTDATFDADVARCPASIDLWVQPALCPLQASPIDFSHTDELIDRAHTTSSHWLERTDLPRDQTAVLSFQRHSPDPEPVTSTAGRRPART
jgi:hypothetical protein